MFLMSGVHLSKKRKIQDRNDLLGLEETLDRLIKANGVQECGQVLR